MDYSYMKLIRTISYLSVTVLSAFISYQLFLIKSEGAIMITESNPVILTGELVLFPALVILSVVFCIVDLSK
jgi:hypothetical protein